MQTSQLNYTLIVKKKGNGYHGGTISVKVSKKNTNMHLTDIKNKKLKRTKLSIKE